MHNGDYLIVSRDALDLASPCFITLTCPAEGEKYRYLKVVVNEVFFAPIGFENAFMGGNDQKYVTVHELEVYTAKDWYYEENILAKKAKDKGLKSYVDTKLSINHKQSLSVNKSLKKIGKYKNLKKSMFYYEKNYNHIGFLKLFILKLFYHISVFFAYLTFWI